MLSKSVKHMCSEQTSLVTVRSQRNVHLCEWSDACSDQLATHVVRRKLWQLLKQKRRFIVDGRHLPFCWALVSPTGLATAEQTRYRTRQLQFNQLFRRADARVSFVVVSHLPYHKNWRSCSGPRSVFQTRVVDMACLDTPRLYPSQCADHGHQHRDNQPRRNLVPTVNCVF